MITAMIIISFTFFGTYSAFTSSEKADTVAFIAVDGSKVYRTELNNLVHLIASDAVDIQHRYAGNPFNDGFIAKDILETGLAEVIVSPYLPAMKNELTTRLEKEKRFVPYANPNANFLSAEQTWTYFAPDIKKWFDQLRIQSDAASMDAFTARVKLFSAERQFPATFLKQLIRYQEKEQEWLAPDQELAYRDLSLFGYHSVQDWFGKDFVELIAKYIINTAKIAESRGYKASNDEVLSSLIANVKASYNESKRDPYFKSANFNDYFQQEMRHIGMDQTRLVQTWKDVVLFRRFFLENQDAVLVSPLPFKDFYRSLNEYVDVELYALPKELRFRTMRDVHKFDLYVNAIRDPKELKKGANPLLPPEKILSYVEVKKVFPELVEKQYRLRYGVVNKEALQTKVGVRTVWEWEVQDANWKKLQDKFPQLAAVKALSEDERFAVLDKIDSKTRAKIDDYSRALIVDGHPEWLQEALSKVVLQEELLKIREEGGKFPFVGIKNRIEFMRALDKVDTSASQPELQAYTQDGVHYYQITVLDKSASPEIVTFAQASADGTLDQLLDKMLEATYQRVRSQKPSQFLQENGEWKPLAEVRDQVANSHFDDLVKLLDREAASQKKESPNFCDFDNKEHARVSCRLFSHVKRLWQKINDNPESASNVLRDQKNKEGASFTDQWKLEKTKERVVRKDGNFPIDIVEAFSLDPQAISKPCFNNKSGISFFAVVEKGILPFDEAVHDKVFEARALLGREVQKELGLLLLKEMQEKDAISIKGE